MNRAAQPNIHASHDEGGHGTLADNFASCLARNFLPHFPWQSTRRGRMFGPFGVAVVFIASVSIVAAILSIPLMSTDAQDRRIDLYRRIEEDPEELMPVM